MKYITYKNDYKYLLSRLKELESDEENQEWCREEIKRIEKTPITSEQIIRLIRNLDSDEKEELWRYFSKHSLVGGGEIIEK